MKFKDYYAILGVEPGCDEAAIKTAYRRLARKYHPDVNKEPDAEEQFKEVGEAYDALRDPERRRAYDQLRGRGYRSGDDISFSSEYEWQQQQPYRFNFDFGHDTQKYSDFFDSLFDRKPNRSAQNPSTRAQISVPLDTVYEGGKVRVSVYNKQLDVRIPQGIAEGQVIRLAGQGNDGGDLLLEVEYAPNPRFEVDGRTVIHTLSLPPWEAALGAMVSVPTLGGRVELMVPAGSENGRKLRLRGRGLPSRDTITPTGDQIVILNVTTPTPTNESQRRAYRRLAEAFADSADS